MALFDSYEDIENGNNCYQGIGSSGTCYGCPHEADCPFFPSDSGLQTSHLIASFADDFSESPSPAPQYEDEDEYEDEIELFPRVMDLENEDCDEDEEDVGVFSKPFC